MRQLRIHTGLLLLAIALLAACTTGEEVVTVELTQSISGDTFGGTLTVEYPEEWVAQAEDNTIAISTREELLAVEFGTRRGGDVSGGVTVILPEALFAYDVSSDDSITFITRAIAQQFAPERENLFIGEPSSFNAGVGREGAIVTGSATGNNNSFGRFALAVVDTGDAYAVVMLATFGDELLVADVVRSMGRTLEYTPA